MEQVEENKAADEKSRARERDMNGDVLSTELAREPEVDAGDLERAEMLSGKGARYGGRDSGLGINGTNDPEDVEPKSG